MATTKKKVVKKKVVESEAKVPQRYEVGYKFPIMVEIVDIESDCDGSYYELQVSADGLCLDDLGGLTKEQFDNLEADNNPSIKKQVMVDAIAKEELKLKEQQAVVAKLKKELKSIK